jgi:ketosteroid isomerase-like protein
MTSANLELVRSIYAAWERGDFSSADWAHPEIEFVLVGEGPDAGVWTGHAGMAEGFRSLVSVWKSFRVEAEEFRELDDERILVLTRRSGRGTTSGLEFGELGAEGANLFHVREGKVTRLVIYPHRADALADLGLSSAGRSAS